MINCNTTFGKLKEVIVGRELELDRRMIDMTFKLFYKENLCAEGLYNSRNEIYKISEEILLKRIQQLDDLADTLSNLGIKVYRPDRVTKVNKISSPYFQTEASSANNVRDLTLVYNDMIIETPVCIRSRIFENTNMYKIFEQAFDHGRGGRWLKAPNTHLIHDTYDLKDWAEERDFDNINPKFEMSIDAPNFLTIGKDVIVNVATDNQFLGYEWVKSFFPDSEFHVIKCADSHIDGELVCLRPGVFLLNPKFVHIKDILPKKFQNWKFLIPEDLTENLDVRGMTDIDIRLASSRGMDINVLSIDENTVVVNKRAIGVKKCLEQNGFDIIEVELDNGEIFAGGIHCSTLDLVRDDSYEYYT